MSEHPPQTIMAELCFAAPPKIDAQKILGAIRQRRPDADLVEGERNGALLVKYHQLHAMYPMARSAPLLNAVTTPVEVHNGRDLTHSGGWRHAAEMLGRCRYSVLITEFLGREVPPQPPVAPSARLAAHRAVLTAVIDATDPLAIWWPGSQQALPPALPVDDLLCGVVNVRTFPDPADPDVAFMDTLGLGQLGLPDLQCHFRYLSRDLMSGLLTNAARFLVSGGRFDGAMRGLTMHQQWPVARGRALADPPRVVMSIDPGDPFAIRPTR